MKKYLSMLLTAALLLCASGMALGGQAQAVRVGSLKGPTTMGLVKLIEDDKSAGAYEFTLAGAADELVPLLAKGELDVALVPANLASVLYNNTQGAIEVLGINTLGVLYVLEAGDTVQSVKDLAGKTLLTTGKGTTPEYALNYVLTQNGIDPAKDLTIEFKTEAAEVAAALKEGTATLAMLPQPLVTAVLAQNPALRVALSLTDEWDKVSEDSALVTGVAVARRAFVQENPDALEAFIAAYKDSVDFVNQNPDQAGEWIAALGIVPQAELAAKAIPLSNIVYIEGDTMILKLKGYLEALYGQNPASVGGSLPGDDFYYLP